MRTLGGGKAMSQPQIDVIALTKEAKVNDRNRILSGGAEMPLISRCREVKQEEGESG